MAAQKNILLIDSDDVGRSMLAAELGIGGWARLRHVGTAAEGAAIAMARDSRLDAIILDVALRDGDGRELCQKLRRHGIKVPILFLTASAGEDDVIAGLDAGANDYIFKPFRTAELMARLRAQLRAFETSEDFAFRIGPYVFRAGAKVLHDPISNRRIRLTEKEAAVLKFLYRSNGEPVGRQTLLRQVWGYNPAADSHTVETHIYRLRRKIEPDAGQIRILVNVGGGYRLCGDDAGEAAVPMAELHHLKLPPVTAHAVQQAA